MRIAAACVLAACSTGGVSLHAQREWLPSHEIVDDDLSALRFTAYSADPDVFEGYRQYPPGGYVAGGADGRVDIADVPDGPYTLQVAYADHSDWYGYDDHSPTWFDVTAGRRDQVAAPPGTMIDLSGVTLGEAWTDGAQLDAACPTTNGVVDDVQPTPFPLPGATSLGAFDWGAGDTALIDATAGDAFVMLHRTEAKFTSSDGVWSGTTATEMFAPPPFSQAPGATTVLTGSSTPLAATLAAEITPVVAAEATEWSVDVSVGPGTDGGVPGAVLAQFVGGSVPSTPSTPIPIVVADPFDPSWPLLVRTTTYGTAAEVIAIGNADVGAVKASSSLLLNGEALGGDVSWGGAKAFTIGVDPDLEGFELDLRSGSATIHVYSDRSSVMLPREALALGVSYSAITTIGSGAVQTLQAWTGFELTPF
ncbi:MAG TPA: hypothetical protein VH143_13760 [Kofleriaceae bacterium]|jgi:hypothetical protein|nr:hypothetical protein [Kofleriaceae bacterium]